MGDGRVAAEVTLADPQRARQTAKALQQRGFLVLHVGRSISVEAPLGTWEETFGVSFTPHTTTVQREIGRRQTYPRADTRALRIPADLADLVADVAFMEPPELH